MQFRPGSVTMPLKCCDTEFNRILQYQHVMHAVLRCCHYTLRAFSVGKGASLRVSITPQLTASHTFSIRICQPHLVSNDVQALFEHPKGWQITQILYSNYHSCAAKSGRFNFIILLVMRWHVYEIASSTDSCSHQQVTQLWAQGSIGWTALIMLQYQKKEKCTRSGCVESTQQAKTNRSNV